MLNGAQTLLKRESGEHWIWLNQSELKRSKSLSRCRVGRRRKTTGTVVGSHSSRLSDNSGRQPALPAGWGWLVAKQLNANPYCFWEAGDFTIWTTPGSCPSWKCPTFYTSALKLKYSLFGNSWSSILLNTLNRFYEKIRTSHSSLIWCCCQQFSCMKCGRTSCSLMQTSTQRLYTCKWAQAEAHKSKRCAVVW